MKILEMLSNGTISAEEAAKILASTPAEAPAAPKPPKAAKAAKAPKAAKATKAKKSTKKKSAKEAAADDAHEIPVMNEAMTTTDATRWLRIRVADADTGKERVKVKLPLGLLRFGVNIGQRFTSEINGMTWDEVDDMLTAEGRTTILDLEEEETIVQVYVE